MICFVIHRVNIYVSKHKFHSFEKMYDFLIILVDFCGNFNDFGWFLITRIQLTKMKRIRIRNIAYFLNVRAYPTIKVKKINQESIFRR